MGCNSSGKIIFLIQSVARESECEIMRREVNLNRAASQMQLPTTGIAALKAATFSKAEILGSCPDTVLPGPWRWENQAGHAHRSTQHKVLGSAENQKARCNKRGSKIHQPQNVNIPPVGPTIPSNPVHRSAPVFSDLFFPFYHSQPPV